MIHYHGTPCGATRGDVAAFLAGRHALIPWIRPEDIGTAAEVCQSIMLDNGAFSAWKSGEPITDWTEYFYWVRNWCQHPAFDFAIIPDVIDGTESDNDALIHWWVTQWLEFPGPASDSIRCAMYNAPVWHLHESLDRLKQLAGRWPRVAIGSSGKWATPGTIGWWNRMSEAMEVVCIDGKPGTKLHGLRMLDPAVFCSLPLASADSTNAVRNSSSYSRFGMYCPPNASTRMGIIAERIERHQSAAIWNHDTQALLFRDGASVEKSRSLVPTNPTPERKGTT